MNSSTEEILWRGQPQARIMWRDALQMQTIIGLVFGGFAIFWIIGARSNSPVDAPLFSLLFPLAGMPFVLIGLWLTLGHLVWDAVLRAGTHYTLTSRSALISRSMLGRRSEESWPLEGIENMELEDGHPGSVLFNVSADLRREQARPMPIKPPISTRRPAIGFRHIDDPRRVHRLISEARARMGQ